MVSYILITGHIILLFMNPLNFKFLQVHAVLFYTFPTASKSRRKGQNKKFIGKHFRSFDMQQKNHRSISLLLFWKSFLLILLAALKLPTFFKNKKRLENKKNVKNVKKRDQNKQT